MKTIAFSLATLLTSVSAPAAVTLFEDNFDSYPDGNLTDAAAWENISGSGEFIQVTSGSIALTHGGGSREDVAAAFADQTAGIVTATFDFTVIDDPFGTGTDAEYFVHFANSGSNFRARLDIQRPTSGGGYTFGISTDTSTAQDTATIDLALGQTYSAELVFDLDTGTSSATINGETVTGAALGAGSTINSINFRQSDSSNDETIVIDNVVVMSSIPEPSAALLGCLAGAVVLLRRRR